MPTNLIPPGVPQFTPSSGQITGPADGDPLTAASVNTTAFQPLADRSLVSFLGLYGVSGSRTIASCLDGVHLVLNPQVVRSSSRVLSGSLGSPIDISGFNTPNTIYYVYGFDNAGTFIPVITTSPPDSTVRYNSANADQAFITWFSTIGGGTPRPFTHTVVCYSFASLVDLVVGGAALTWTQTPLPFIPNFYSQAILSIRLLGSVNSIASVFVVPHGFTAFNPYEMRLTTSSNPGVLPCLNNDSPLMSIIGQGGFDWQLDTAGTQVDIKLLGVIY